MRRRSFLYASLLLALALATSASAQDADNDGVPDSFDNCILAPNGPAQAPNNQCDTDGDGYGNACDFDINQDYVVGAPDFSCFTANFGLTGHPFAACDANCDGVVGAPDFSLFTTSFGRTVGPTCCDAGFPEIPLDEVVCDSTLPDSECTITVEGIPFLTTRENIVVFSQGGAAGAEGMMTNAVAGDAIVVSDDIRIPTVFGEIGLLEGIITFTVGPTGNLDTITGTVRVPFPDLGFMAGVQVDETPMATMGIDLGANIDLGIPLLPNVHYLFFNFSANFGASLGPVTFDVGGPDATLVMDPYDPFTFMGGSLGGLLPDGGGDPPPSALAAATFVEPDFGFGISLGAMIPFEPNPSCFCDHDPRTTGGPLDATCNQCVADICAVDAACCSSGWDAQCVAAIDTVCDGSAAQFMGHLLVKAPIPLGTLPLTLNGIAIANIDPQMDGTIFQLSPDMQLGGNGTVSVGVPFLKFFEFGFDLGDASASVEYVENDVSACFSGLLNPDDPFAMFPPEFPIPIKQSPQQVGASVKGGFSTANPETSFVKAEGNFSVDLGPLGDQVGVNLGELGSTSVLLDIDETGLLFAGMTSTQVIPDLTNAAMSLTVRIPTDDVLDSSAELIGALTIAGLGLDPARMFISPVGFEIEGNLDLSPIATLMVFGGVSSSGVLLTGVFDTSVTFDLQATVDDAIAIFQDAVDIAQDALDFCLDACPGDCYLNPCCITCEGLFLLPLTTAELALLAAEEAADLFFDGLLDILGISLSGTVAAHVDVTIDGFNAWGAVSASLNGVVLAGSARFNPPQVCVTLPLASIPGADTLGIDDADFCVP